MIGHEQGLEVDSLKMAISFLLTLCSEDHEVFAEHGLAERSVLDYEITGLDLAIQSAVGVGLLRRESAGGESILLPGPRWSEIEDALVDQD